MDIRRFEGTKNGVFVFLPTARVPPKLTSSVVGNGNGRYVDVTGPWMSAGIPGQPAIISRIQPLPLMCSFHPSLQTLFLGAGHQPGQGYQQEVMTTTGPPPVMFAPVTSETLSVDTAVQSLDLQMLKPETFSCGLPALDLPVPVLHPMPIVNTSSLVVKSDDRTKPKPSLPKPKRKSEPKSRALKPKPKKAVPEKKPFFEPVPLGAKHAKTKIQFLGDKIAMSKRPGIYQALRKAGPGDSGINQNPSVKCVTSRKCYKALVSELPLFSEKDQHKSCKTFGSVKACQRGQRSESNTSDRCIEKAVVSESNNSDVCESIQNVTSAKGSGKDSSGAASAEASTDEYEIEYLYLTKFILRKKNQPLGQKRKCSDEEQPAPSSKRHKGESRDLKNIPEVFHFQDTESLLSSDILDLF